MGECTKTTPTVRHGGTQVVVGEAPPCFRAGARVRARGRWRRRASLSATNSIGPTTAHRFVSLAPMAARTGKVDKTTQLASDMQAVSLKDQRPTAATPSVVAAGDAPVKAYNWSRSATISSARVRLPPRVYPIHTPIHPYTHPSINPSLHPSIHSYIIHLYALPIFPGH